jgi:hypothetical protein
MPYRDPERKRQWEREHREERNSRRRKALSSMVRGGLGSPKPGSVIGHESSTGTNIIAMLIVVAFTVAVILISKRSRFRIVSEGTTRAAD